MVAKNHCKVHYGDDDDEEEVELEEFYDYTSRFVWLILYHSNFLFKTTPIGFARPIDTSGIKYLYY